MSVAVLVASLAVSLAMVASANRAGSGNFGAIGSAVLASSLVVVAVHQRHQTLAASAWDEYTAGVTANAVAGLREALSREAAALDRLAATALGAPADAAGAFRFLESRAPRAPYRGVVLFDEDGPVAWSGTLRAPTQQRVDPGSLDWSPFYLTLRRTVERGSRRAVAEAVIHANPPADRIAASLESGLRFGPELAGFEYRPSGVEDPEWHELTVDGRALLAARPRLLSQGEAVQHESETARRWGGAGLLLSLLVLTAVAWRRPASTTRRLAVLAAVLGLVAMVPFNAFSNVAAIFNPGIYYASILGPLSGSVAALAATSALFLLALFAIFRSRLHLGGRWIAALFVLLVASLGPFLLRDLARGISLPGHGASIQLWLSWQVPLFMAAAAILLAGASAGRMLLVRGRGGNPWVAPGVAAVAAVSAPLLWQAPGRWPAWYPALWIVAVGALALARRTRAAVLSVGLVAACGATTLVWYAVTRARVQLAESDVAGLSTPDPASQVLLDRLAASIASGPPPQERTELLQRYAESPLAASGQPVELASWLSGDSIPHATLRIAEFATNAEVEREVARQARDMGESVRRSVESPQGRQLVVAIPHESGAVTTIVVAPRSPLVEGNPFSLLTGLERPSTSDLPYELVLTALPSPVPLSERPSWIRRGNELHGDWLVPGAGDASRAHVEVEIRSLDVLIPRGAMIVLLDLLVFGVIWTLAAGADGGLWRWAGGRAGAWGRSYRGRLTVTLFAFFVIPAGGFAFWAYDRLIQTDNESRALLLRETLRAVTTSDGLRDLAAVADRFDTPLFAYQGGALYQASDPLYAQLAPAGQFLPPPVAVGLGVESEVTVTDRPVVAGAPLLFGYRSVGITGGGRAVLAAPARLNDRALDRQRRDIGILVLFVTSLGALAALALSGAAARELERPVGALRLAALRIARGERYPRPDRAPAREFVPVFTAFERMDADLSASRAALEEAQRRTESVLRDVASGVIATDRLARVMLANPGAEALLGHPVTPGKTLRELGDHALAERTEGFLDDSADEEAFDLVIGGRQVRGNLARLARGTGGAVLTLEDVTDLARAQRVLAWGEMARQVAHEIKNPLTPIRLGVQHLRRARGDPRVDFSRIFEQNVERILAEIDRLDEIARAFSRYGMGAAERAEPEALDVAAITRDVVELERMGEGAIAWSLVGAEGPALAMARDDELREVLLNVLENARQAGARQVSVEVRRTGDRVDLVVTDDGTGVAAADLSRIFEPRFSTRTSGSGLGLAISRGLVESWGGRMQAASAAGRGTEMRVSLVAVSTA